MVCNSLVSENKHRCESAIYLELNGRRIYQEAVSGLEMAALPLSQLVPHRLFIDLSLPRVVLETLMDTPQRYNASGYERYCVQASTIRTS